MKKNLFLTLIIALIVATTPSVKAYSPIDLTTKIILDPSSTKNIFDENYEFNMYEYSGSEFYITPSVNYASNLNLIPVESNNTYTFSTNISGYSNFTIFYLNENLSYISRTSAKTFTTPSTAKYIIFHLNSQAIKNNADGTRLPNYYIQIEKGSTATEYVSYEKFVEPDVLETFYGIFTSKIQQIAQYGLENKFILSAIAIVLLFVVLNFFLYLFNKGGYKR